MRTISSLILSLIAALTVSATDYDGMWQKVNDARNKDLPKQVLASLKPIITTAEKEHNYGELLAAQLCYARTEAEISTDSLPGAIRRLQQQAQEIEHRAPQTDELRALAAVYNAVLAEIVNINKDINLQDEGTPTPAQYYERAMQHPDVLAAVKTDAYKRLITEGKNDEIFNHDLLSLIGNKAGQYVFLTDYYLQHGNRSAACVELLWNAQSIDHTQDDRSLSNRRDILRQGMDMLGDVPEAALLAADYYQTMEDDNDITDSTRYVFLTEAIERWGASQYVGTLKNRLERLCQPRISVNIEEYDMHLTSRAVKDVSIIFHRLKIDGSNTEFNDYLAEKDVVKLRRLVDRQGVVTVKRQYAHPVWHEALDTIAKPQLEPGVYLVETKADRLTAYSLLYHSDLALLNVSHSKKEHRFVVVNKHTGVAVKNATIQLTEENYQGKVKDRITLQCDANGEALFSSPTERMRHNRIYVSTPDDHGFKKQFLNTYFYLSNSKQKQDIITMFTDRAIYRPGQTLKGSIIVHNAYNEDSIRVVANKEVTVTLRNTEYKEVAKDTVTTDSHGNAGFSFTLPTNERNGTFTLTCTAKDARTANNSVRVEEYKRPTFTVETPDSLEDKTFADGDEVNVRIRAVTMTQLPVANAKVVYSINRFNRWFWWRGNNNNRIIVSNDTVTTDADGYATIPLDIRLPEEGRGIYAFTISCNVTDETGESHPATVTITAHRNIKATDDALQQEPPTPLPEFQISSENFPLDGGKVLFTVRPRKEDRKANEPVTLYYTLSAGEKVLEKGSKTFKDSTFVRAFQYKKEYGEGLSLSYVWMLHGEAHTYSTTIGKPKPDLKLNTEWVTFRDRTTPGSQETWTLKVTDTKGRAVESTLTATIFDKSLDLLKKHSWALSVLRNSYYVSNSWRSIINNDVIAFKEANLNVIPELYVELPSFDSSLFPTRYNRYFGARPPVIKYNKEELNEVVMVDYNTKHRMQMAKASAAPTSIAAFDVRGNDEAGGTVLSKMEDIQAEPEVDLSAMVRTNLGETAFFTPSLVADADGTLNISFTLPETMTTWRMVGVVHDSQMRHAFIDTECVAKKSIIVKPNVPRFLREGDKGTLVATVSNTTDATMEAEVIMQLLKEGTDEVLWQNTQNVTLDAQKSVGVDAQFPVIADNEAVIYRVVARTASGASDGEQHIIPVLSAREIVTHTIAFTQHGPGTFSKDISDLLYDGSTDRRMTLRYAEHAIQMILDCIPTTVTPSHNDALSLASALYVQQMFSIADTAKVVSRLEKLQKHDGSWAWWEGMNGSVYMTTGVAKLLARLKYHGVNSKETDKMLKKAMPFMMKYLSNEADYLREYLKKHPKHTPHPSETATDIMYIAALTDQSLKSNKDVKFLMDLMERVPTEFTIYGKAHAAVLLALYNRTAAAKNLLQSLKEYSVCTPEAGRYYDTRKAFYSWRNYRIPTEVAAMEAIRLLTPQDTTSIEEMQRWLLHEKRTQQWDTSINTTDAIHAFMLDNNELKAYEESKAKGDVSFTDIRTDTLTIPANNIFTHTKTTSGTSWGGLFIEQKAPLASIKSQGSGFTVKREVIGNTVVGNKVTVRITISADRDYDFVTVTDNRPACLEPVQQLSGYCAADTYGTALGSFSGYYRETKDKQTRFHFNHLAKGQHVITTDYYVDRQGTYTSGTCTVECAYAPEFSALCAPQTIITK